MSYDDGWAALNLEMPGRVPRTEYSASEHWGLVSRVTGKNVSSRDDEATLKKANNEFISSNGWNYDFVWNVLINKQYLGKFSTNMGHAEFAAGGTDFQMESTSWCTSPEDVLAFDPESQLPEYIYKDLIRHFEEHYAKSVSNAPEAVNMTGIYITLVSGLIDMFGWDNLLTAAGLDAKKFGEVTNSYARWVQKYFDAMADSDVPVIMVHDDIVWTSGPFISPAWYREFIFPHYKNFFRPLLDSGKKIMYTSDGNYNEFVDDIAASGIHGFVMEPTTDMGYIAQRYGKTHAFIGNADTRILLFGTKDEIRQEVKRCMDIGKDCPGFFMAVGNHIPANTPVENALYYNEVYEELSRR